MGLVKTRRLAAMQKQQRAKAGIELLTKGGKIGLPMKRGKKERNVRMNKFGVMIILAAFAFQVDARIGSVSGRVNGYDPGRVPKTVSDGGASDAKAKGMPEKQARAKAKTISADRLVIPDDAKYHGNLSINKKGRIESLCGFTIGDIAKVPRLPTLDKDGNIVETGKLAKPFRNCTHYEVKYSASNHALYSICVFSPAIAKMDDDAAAKELDTMATAVKMEFDNKINRWTKGPSLYIANMGASTRQSLRVESSLKPIDKRHVLKGTTDAREEKGWAFSISLVDRAMQEFNPDPQEPKPPENIEGIDAL